MLLYRVIPYHVEDVLKDTNLVQSCRLSDSIKYYRRVSFQSKSRTSQTENFLLAIGVFRGWGGSRQMRNPSLPSIRCEFVQYHAPELTLIGSVEKEFTA